MKELIEELRQAADVKPADCPELFEKAANAIESQAATIDRYETTAENYELLQAKVDEQAREVASKQLIIDGMNEAHWKVVQELASLKAKPSAVVLPPSPYMPDTDPDQMTDYERGEAQGRCDMWAEVKRLSSSHVSAGDESEKAALQSWLNKTGPAVKPMEVIGYASPGQVEILRSLPRTGGMKVKGSKDDRYSEPVVLLSEARTAVMSAVIRCEQKGAFKTCLECGYQDGHDQICQYHESKRAVVSATDDPVAIVEYAGYEPANSLKWLNKGLAYMEPGTKLYTRAALTAPAPGECVAVPVDIARRMAADAAQYDHEHAIVNDNVQLWQQPNARLSLTVGDLRAVRALLARHGKAVGDE